MKNVITIMVQLFRLVGYLTISTISDNGAQDAGAGKACPGERKAEVVTLVDAEGGFDG